MTFEVWRLAYQDVEQAARAAYMAAANARAINEKLEQELAEAKQLAEAAVERAELLAYQLDESQGVVLQLTASSLNFHRRCKELEKRLQDQTPRPLAVRRISDQSLEVIFHSCRLASEFERLTSPGEKSA